MLTGIILVPLAGAALAVGLRRDARLTRWVALGAAVAELVLALAVFVLFDTTAGGYDFEVRVAWVSAFGIEYHLGWTA